MKAPSRRTVAGASVVLASAAVFVLSACSRPADTVTADGLDIALPIEQSHVLGPLMTECLAVGWSDGVFRGEVMDVSLSAYNTPNGQYSPELEVWDGEELVEDFVPHRYYTVTFSVAEWWFNPDDIGSTVHVWVHGYSPVDPADLPVWLDEIVFKNDYEHTWTVGDDVVAMVGRRDMVGREMYQTNLQYVYFVAPDGTLTNIVSSWIERSTTLSQLQAVVGDCG